MARTPAVSPKRGFRLAPPQRALILVLACLAAGCPMNAEQKAATAAATGAVAGIPSDGADAAGPEVEVVRRLASLMEECPAGDLQCLARRQAIAAVSTAEFDDADCNPESTDRFGGGAGTAERPYLVCSAAQLYNIRFEPEAYFYQTRGIDLRGGRGTGGNSFDPIPEFSGFYDGAGHEILGLVLRSVPSTAGAGGAIYLGGLGLFVHVGHTALLRRVHLRGPSVIPNVPVPTGALAGVNEGTVLDSAVHDGVVSAVLPGGSAVAEGAPTSPFVGSNKGLLQDVRSLNGRVNFVATGGTVPARLAAGEAFEKVGGIAGFNDGIILRAQSQGAINAAARGARGFGGIAGVNQGSISESSAAMALAGTRGRRFGGIAGENSGLVRRCTVTANVQGALEVGGIAGYNSATVEDSAFRSSAAYSNLGEKVGGVVGFNEGGAIRGCQSTGAVYGVSAIGGIVGHNGTGIVERCFSAGRVGHTTYLAAEAGGVVGVNGELPAAGKRYDPASVSRSYSTATIYAGREAAGFVGTNQHNGVIGDAYATGSVVAQCGRADLYVGGFAARNYGEINRVYSAGCVRPNDATAGRCRNTAATLWPCGSGGLIGTGRGGTVQDSYWNTATAGITVSDGGAGQATAALRLQATFVDWDFNAVWMPPSGAYPALRGF